MRICTARIVAQSCTLSVSLEIVAGRANLLVLVVVLVLVIGNGKWRTRDDDEHEDEFWLRLQPHCAVSPICNRRSVEIFQRARTAGGPQESILRYGRFQICATPAGGPFALSSFGDAPERTQSARLSNAAAPVTKGLPMPSEIIRSLCCLALLAACAGLADAQPADSSATSPPALREVLKDAHAFGADHWI